MLERLGFSLPEFMRVAWVSEEAQEYWEPKIRAISRAWPSVELASLTSGLRRGVLLSVTPEELIALHTWTREKHVPMTVLGMEGANKGYSNAALPYVPGKPFIYRVFLGEDLDRFVDAWKGGDEITIGRILGYPICCTEAFYQHWKLDGWRDLTHFAFEEKENRNLMYNNVLLRHLGIRGVFHLPCSVNCKESWRTGVSICELMTKMNLVKEEQWLKQLLSMPMEWSSLHGIAIVTTPILKLIHNTDAIARSLTLHLVSDYYPEMGAAGNRFPFINVKPLHLVTDPRLNGFKTERAMQEAHDFLINQIPADLSGKILDLGCGNGRLLARIGEERESTLLFGVECNLDTLERKIKGPLYYQGNMFQIEEPWENFYDLVLVSIQRFREVPREDATKLIEKLFLHCERLLLYTYDDWWHGVDDVLFRFFEVVDLDMNGPMHYEAKRLVRKEIADESSKDPQQIVRTHTG